MLSHAAPFTGVILVWSGLVKQGLLVTAQQILALLLRFANWSFLRLDKLIQNIPFIFL